MAFGLDSSPATGRSNNLPGGVAAFLAGQILRVALGPPLPLRSLTMPAVQPSILEVAVKVAMGASLTPPEGATP